MDLFDIDPNALIILVIMIIGALKWLFDKLKGEQQLRDDEGEPPTPFHDLYEEARREIRERQARTTQPPSESLSRPAIFEPLHEPAPTRTTPPPLPTAARTPGKTKPSAERSPYQAKAPRPKLSAAERAALERLQRQGLPSRRGRRGRRSRRSHSRVRQLLATPSATRDAIVLREILGPPKGAMWDHAESG